jgi:hypothetical protein
MDDTKPPEAKPSLWETIARLCKEHPIVGPLGVLGALASIIAVPLAFIFWCWPVTPKRELTYAIQPVRAAIVQVNRQSDIVVTYKGQRITGDLCAAQVMIANAGAEPIEYADILGPVALVVSNAAVIECNTNIPAKDGTDFLVETNIASGRINLSWKILEQGDNPVVQILYAGQRNAPIVLEGRVKGQGPIKQVAWPESKSVRWRHFATGWLGGLVGMAAALVVSGRKGKRRNLILAGLTLLTVCIVMYCLDRYFPAVLR